MSVSHRGINLLSVSESEEQVEPNLLHDLGWEAKWVDPVHWCRSSLSSTHRDRAVHAQRRGCLRSAILAFCKRVSNPGQGDTDFPVPRDDCIRRDTAPATPPPLDSLPPSSYLSHPLVSYASSHPLNTIPPHLLLPPAPVSFSLPYIPHTTHTPEISATNTMGAFQQKVWLITGTSISRYQPPGIRSRPQR